MPTVKKSCSGSEIDFATFEHFEPKTTAELVKHFDENLQAARDSLQNLSDETLAESFHLKNQRADDLRFAEKGIHRADHQSSGSSSRAVDGFYAAQRYSRACDLRTFGG